MPTPAPTPGPRPRAATYRVQLHAGFTFDDAAAITGYLAELGVSHLYCSPYLQAAPGSTHGYDVVDPGGSTASWAARPATAGWWSGWPQAGLGQVLDIVPNHMALAGRANAWWWDVLENGPSSRYASYFDIDWDPPQRKLAAHRAGAGPRRPLRPGAGGGRSGRRAAGRRFVVRYHEHEAPISPRTLDEPAGQAPRPGPARRSWTSLAAAFGRLPHGRR